jgi:enoyl-CoA hydratase/carnithine racemase
MTDERKVEGAPVPPIAEERSTALFVEEELTGYRARWSGIQTGFVDEPRKAVEEADALVAELMKRLTDVFAGERQQLEAQWERSDKISTEDLRIAMRRYRSFFERLLAI